MKEFRESVKKCFDEAQRKKELHARYASNYTIIMTKAHMLLCSLDNLARMQDEQKVLTEQSKIALAVKQISEDICDDYSEFDT